MDAARGNRRRSCRGIRIVLPRRNERIGHVGHPKIPRAMSARWRWSRLGRQRLGAAEIPLRIRKSSAVRSTSDAARRIVAASLSASSIARREGSAAASTASRNPSRTRCSSDLQRLISSSFSRWTTCRSTTGRLGPPRSFRRASSKAMASFVAVAARASRALMSRSSATITRRGLSVGSVSCNSAAMVARRCAVIG